MKIDTPPEHLAAARAQLREAINRKLLAIEEEMQSASIPGLVELHLQHQRLSQALDNLGD